MSEHAAALADLHTKAVDAREGYRKGLALAEPEVAGLFRDLLGMHCAHAEALAAALRKHGVTPDDDGSFLQYVHKAVLSARSALGGLDTGAVSGLRDGEQRILDSYDDALDAVSGEPDLAALVESQRDAVAERVLRLGAIQPGADA